MPSNLVRNIHIFQPRDVFNRSQTCNSPNTTSRRSEKIIQYPIIPRKRIDISPRDHRSRFAPVGLGHGQSGPKQEHILHNPKCLLTSEFEKGVKDDAGTQRETDEGDGSYSKMALNQDFSEDFASRFGTIESVTPWVVNEVAELRQNYT